MKVLTAGLSVLGLALLTGCGPELAQAPYGSEEAAWLKAFEENYSGYRPPRMAPPATVDNVSPRLIEAEQQTPPAQGGIAAAPAAAEDPANAAVAPAADEVKAPAAAEDPASVVDKAADKAPAADKKEEAKEVKVADKKEGEKKAEDFAATPPDPTSGTVYVVKAGDTLGGIARKQYGKASFADLIRRANVDLVKDPNRLRPGMKLIIPKL